MPLELLAATTSIRKAPRFCEWGPSRSAEPVIPESTGGHWRTSEDIDDDETARPRQAPRSFPPREVHAQRGGGVGAAVDRPSPDRRLLPVRRGDQQALVAG